MPTSNHVGVRLTWEYEIYSLLIEVITMVVSERTTVITFYLNFYFYFIICLNI